MNPRTGHSARQEVKVGLRADPRVVLRSQVLELTQPELQQLIETELSENPALERLEDDEEPLTNEAVLRAVAPHELRPTSEDFEFRRSVPSCDETLDWLEFTTAEPSLADHLRAQLACMLPPEMEPLGNYLIGCLDERGYFTSSVEEVTLATGWPLDEVERAYAALKRCEPAGIGASSLQECLFLQLRHADTVEQKLARAIVKSHWEEFVARRVSKLMRRFKTVPEVIEAAFEEILRLTPYPADGFHPSPSTTVGSRTMCVMPDLSLTRTEAGWLIEVMGAEPTAFMVSRSYRARLEELKRKACPDKAEQNHVQTYIQRAEQFIDSLAERRRTLRRIGEYLIAHQFGFVTTGQYQFLLPLTKSQLAKDLDIHESSVSRATMGKFVRIANGEVVPFDVFFKPALRVQKMIEEILATENPNRPLSDEEIARRLAQKGVRVARRTVNKYRDRVKLLSSRARRSA